MTQDLSPKEIQQLVEERALAIAKAAELPDVKAEEKLDPWFVIDRLRRNRVGDADLFVTLFRGQYAYVPEWDKWLYWSGHHWDIDLLSRRALADIEQVCAAYQNAIVETGQDDKSPLSKTMRSRIDKLRTAAGRKEVLECATSIYNPPVVAANDLDQQHYHLATPSGVVDLRTGECSPGKPEQYMLNAIPTEWTGLDTPCPNFQHYLLSCMNGDQEMARLHRAPAGLRTARRQVPEHLGHHVRPFVAQRQGYVDEHHQGYPRRSDTCPYGGIPSHRTEVSSRPQPPRAGAAGPARSTNRLRFGSKCPPVT